MPAERAGAGAAAASGGEGAEAARARAAPHPPQPQGAPPQNTSLPQSSLSPPEMPPPALRRQTSLEVPLVGRLLVEEEAKFGFCVVGIMSSLVMYGLMQERIVRHPYGGEDGQGAPEFFNSSLFLVFCNRVFTCLCAACMCKLSGHPLAPACPAHKYGSVSLSNVVATTCQYEALKFVSFPVQTLAKCAKMMPVLFWGTIMSGKRYKVADYAAAVVVTLSCTLFLLESAGDDSGTETRRDVGDLGSTGSTVYGMGLMVCYLSFDGFTSTFQDKLFAGYEDMSTMNQVMWVTTFSTGVTLLSLVSSGQIWPAAGMLARHPALAWHVLLLSLAASAGQFFITATIKNYGALPFATVMTTRQLVSILLSCSMYGPPLTVAQWCALAVTFVALYARAWSKRGGGSTGGGDSSGGGEKERLVSGGSRAPSATGFGGDVEFGGGAGFGGGEIARRVVRAP